MFREKKRIPQLLFIFCYSIAVAGVFYWIGYKTAYDRMERADPTLIPQTFYATISDIQGNHFTVTGMDVNDINFRTEFCFSVAEETKITWRYTDISIDNLEIGDSVSITFSGEILETSPGQIQHVDVIQLLDDQM